MANGFFQGGFAEGALGAQKMALAERELNENTALRSRGLDIQGRQLEHNISQDILKQADGQIATTMEQAGAIIKAGLEGGSDPAAIRKTVLPLVNSVIPIAQRVGRDPNALIAQIDAQLAAPTPVARAGVAGTAAGTQRVAQARAEQQPDAPPGTRVEISPFKDEKDRVSAENALRDDYTARSKDFITLRDFKDRIDNMPATGIGDVGLVFSFMKVLDPGSTVREGEFATAANAAGVPSAVRAVWNKLVGDGKLDATGRKELRDAAQAVFGPAAARHSNLTNQFAKIAQRQGLRVKNVIVDFTSSDATPASGTTSTGIKWNWRGE